MFEVCIHQSTSNQKDRHITSITVPLNFTLNFFFYISDFSEPKFLTPTLFSFDNDHYAWICMFFLPVDTSFAEAPSNPLLNLSFNNNAFLYSWDQHCNMFEWCSVIFQVDGWLQKEKAWGEEKQKMMNTAEQQEARQQEFNVSSKLDNTTNQFTLLPSMKYTKRNKIRRSDYC